MRSDVAGHLDALFAAEDRPSARRLLGQIQPGLLAPGASREELARCRIAALKLSGGKVPRLKHAIALARLDYRDLLMAAGFGHDVRAHHRFDPTS